MRRPTKSRSNTLLLLAILALASASCGSQAGQVPSMPTAAAPPAIAEVKPTATATPPAIRVLRVMPVSQVTRNDEYYFDNCSPDIPATRPFSEVAQVQMAVAVAGQATQLTGAATAPIPEAVKGQLVAEVAKTYQDTFAAAKAEVAGVTLFANAHDRYTVVIVWDARLYSGSVSFPMDGVTYTAEYTYTLEVPRTGTIKPGICTP